MIIAIGGASNAGKSRLARMISDEYSNSSVKILCQDDFVFPEKDLPKIRDHIDWEIPESIDFKSFKAEIQKASAENDLVIVEGLMVYADDTINELYSRMIFIEIKEETFRKRKNEDLRWGKEPDWYISHIWKKHLEHGQAPTEGKVFFLYAENVLSVKSILNFLNK